jgi:hypothetical protein
MRLPCRRRHEGKIAEADVASMSSSYSLWEASRNLAYAQAVQYQRPGYVEGPYPEHGLHERFHWVFGRKLRINVPCAGAMLPSSATAAQPFRRSGPHGPAEWRTIEVFHAVQRASTITTI